MTSPRKIDAMPPTDPPNPLAMQVDASTTIPQKSSFLHTLLTPSPNDLLPPNTQPIPLDIDLTDEADNPYDT